MNKSTDPSMRLGRFTSVVRRTTRPILGIVLALVAVALFTVLSISQAPTATTGAATDIGGAIATLNGTVNANGGGTTTVTFEYGFDTDYGATWTAAESPVSGSTETLVTATVTGLNSETTYHYRVVGVNANGTANGDDVTFTTLHVIPPTVTSIVRRNPTNEYTNVNTVTFRVTFDEDVQYVSIADFVLSGSASGSIDSVSTVTAESVYDVEITSVSGDGELDLDIANGNDIQDTAGNPLGNAPGIGTEETYAIDNTPPLIPCGLSPANNSYTTDISPTLSWDPSSDEIGGSGLRATNTYRVNVTGPPHKDYYTPTSNPEYTPTLAEGVFTWKVYARDNAGNASDYSIIYTFGIDGTSPDVAIDHAGAQADPTNGSPVEFTVAFSEPIDVGTFTDGDVMVGGTAATGTVTVSEIAPNDGTTFSASVVVTGDGTVTVTIPAGGVEDLAGNTNTASSSTDNTVTYDTTAPIDPTPSSSSHAVNVVSNDPTVDIEISGASDSGGSGVCGFDVAWDQNAVWVATEVKDQEETWTGGTFTVTSDGKWYFHIATVDSSGNWTSTRHLGPFTIDTNPPMVSDVTVSDTQITDANTPGTATFTVTVEFDETMDTGVAPAVGFSSGVATTLALNVAQSGWSDSDTYVAKYDVADGNVDHDSVTIDVAGAQDPAGNGQTDYTPEPEFQIDTRNPTVVSVTSTPTQIADATAGAGTFAVEVQFSESMDAGAAPTFVFDPTDNVTTGLTPTLSKPSGGWGGTTDTYTVTYDVADVNVEIDDIDVRVTGAQDIVGNTQVPYDQLDVFGIDTLNPTIASITSTTPDGYYGVGEAIDVTVTFSENVALGGGALEVTLDTPSDAVRLLGFVSSTSALTTYTVGEGDNSCDLDAIGVALLDLVGVILRDDAGNDADVFLPATTIADGSDIVVDTTDPTIGAIGIGTDDDRLDTNCEKMVSYAVTVTDNCCIDVDDPGSIIVTPSATNAAVSGLTVALTPDAGKVTSAVVSGTFVVSVGDACTMAPSVRIDVEDCAGNTGSRTDLGPTIADATGPTFSDFTVAPDDGWVDANCEEVVSFSVDVHDNCSIDLDDPTAIVVTESATNASTSGLAWSADKAGLQSDFTITGTFMVEDLTGCPAVPTVEVRVTDLCGNAGTASQDGAGIEDGIVPVIHDLVVEQHVVDDCCEVEVGFSVHVTDNCCVTPSGITITPTNPTGNLTIDFDQARDVTITQNGQGRVDISGVIPVQCVTSCPAIVQVTLRGEDCSGNSAVPESSTAGADDSNETGHVADEIAPIPRDDPRQDVETDESAILDPLMKVRVDRSGTYRLLVREGAPVNLNVVANDSDNCSCVAHDPCAACSGCDAALRIYDIVDPPGGGTAAIVDAERTTRGDTTSIRYAPARDCAGPDQFTYRIVDACGNVSSEATVYVEVVARSGMEDLFLTTCTDASVEFDVTATDPLMDPEDPGSVPFEFSILNPPAHGVVSGDLTGIVYTAAGATTADVASATIVLTYTPAAGFVGRDRMTVQCVDPFGASSEAVIDVTVEDCTEEEEEEPPPIPVEQGVTLSMILPSSFRSILESAWGSVLLVSLEDGLAYPGVLSAMWDESAGQYVLEVNTEGLAPGEYRLTLALGNGETVELTIEVGEVE